MKEKLFSVTQFPRSYPLHFSTSLAPSEKNRSCMCITGSSADALAVQTIHNHSSTSWKCSFFFFFLFLFILYFFCFLVRQSFKLRHDRDLWVSHMAWAPHPSPVIKIESHDVIPPLPNIKCKRKKIGHDCHF